MNALRPVFPSMLGAAEVKAAGFNNCTPPATAAGFANTAWLESITFARLSRTSPSPGIAVEVPYTVWGSQERKAASPATVQLRSSRPAFDCANGAGTFQYEKITKFCR